MCSVWTSARIGTSVDDGLALDLSSFSLVDRPSPEDSGVDQCLAPDLSSLLSGCALKSACGINWKCPLKHVWWLSFLVALCAVAQGSASTHNPSHATFLSTEKTNVRRHNTAQGEFSHFCIRQARRKPNSRDPNDFHMCYLVETDRCAN